MYLVMMNNKPSPFEEMNVRKLLVEASGAEYSYSGESMKQIKLNLEKERDDTVVVSADSRLLQLVPTHFPMESVYLFEGGVLVKIQDTTARQLKTSHNLMKLFEAEEFKIPDRLTLE